MENKNFVCRVLVRWENGERQTFFRSLEGNSVERLCRLVVESGGRVTETRVVPAALASGRVVF